MKRWWRANIPTIALCMRVPYVWKAPCLRCAHHGNWFGCRDGYACNLNSASECHRGKVFRNSSAKHFALPLQGLLRQHRKHFCATARRSSVPPPHGIVRYCRDVFFTSVARYSALVMQDILPRCCKAFGSSFMVRACYFIPSRLCKTSTRSIGYMWMEFNIVADFLG